MAKLNVNGARDKDISWEIDDDGTLTATSETIPDWSFHVHRPVSVPWVSHQPGENPRHFASLEDVVKDIETKHAESLGEVNRDRDEILAVLGNDE